MGFIELASYTSAARGYEYFKQNRILYFEKLSDSLYNGIVRGSEGKRYDVYIDLEHPRKSRCNCPHADGRTVICKHKVALYFYMFPKEAETYRENVIREREEAERQQEEMILNVEKCVRSLSKPQLEDILLTILNENEWVFERFARDYLYEYLYGEDNADEYDEYGKYDEYDEEY